MCCLGRLFRRCYTVLLLLSVVMLLSGCLSLPGDHPEARQCVSWASDAKRIVFYTEHYVSIESDELEQKEIFTIDRSELVAALAHAACYEDDIDVGGFIWTYGNLVNLAFLDARGVRLAAVAISKSGTLVKYVRGDAGWSDGQYRVNRVLCLAAFALMEARCKGMLIEHRQSMVAWTNRAPGMRGLLNVYPWWGLDDGIPSWTPGPPMRNHAKNGSPSTREGDTGEASGPSRIKKPDVDGSE